MPTPRLNVRAKADELIDELTKAGKIAVGDATEVPPFSAGTQALDEAGVTTDSPDVPRDPSGRFVGTRPDESGETIDPLSQPDAASPSGARPATTGSRAPAAAQPDAAAPPTPSGEEGASAAAEGAAAALADDWAEYDEITYDDADTGASYKVRAKKSDAKMVQNGYARRSIMDRTANYLRDYKAVLEPLIATGQIKNIIPMLQQALNDPEYAQYVADAYQRRVAGKPLVIAEAMREAAAAGAATTPATTAANADPNAPVYRIEDDPFLASAMAPVLNELNTLREQVGGMTAAQRQQAEQAEQARRQQQVRVQQFAAAHQDLVTRLPMYFTGDYQQDEASLKHVTQYAKDAGYFDRYDVRAALVLAADQLARAREEAGSPAAAAMAEAERAATVARRGTEDLARSVGGGASTPPVPPRPPKPITTMTTDASGRTRPKSVRDFTAEVLARHAATA